MRFSNLKRLSKILQNTPLHPQWHIYKNKSKTILLATHNISGSVLDIGCADKYLKSHIANDCFYLGVDFLTTASVLYSTKPDIYGDGQKLPIKSGSFSSIAALEVLEHIPNPSACIRESHRVLAQGGKFVVSTPFIYPIHDAPFDFTRWTKYGLISMLANEGFKIEKTYSIGNIGETFSLISCIGLAKTCLNMINSKNPLAFIIILFSLVAIPILNILGLLISFLNNDEDFMPYGYLCHCIKE